MRLQLQPARGRRTTDWDGDSVQPARNQGSGPSRKASRHPPVPRRAPSSAPRTVSRQPAQPWSQPSDGRTARRLPGLLLLLLLLLLRYRTRKDPACPALLAYRLVDSHIHSIPLHPRPSSTPRPPASRKKKEAEHDMLVPPPRTRPPATRTYMNAAVPSCLPSDAGIDLLLPRARPLVRALILRTEHQGPTWPAACLGWTGRGWTPYQVGAE